MVKVNKHDTLPSFKGQSVSVTTGDNITFRKVPQNEVGTSVVYKNSNSQFWAKFYLADGNKVKNQLISEMNA